MSRLLQSFRGATDTVIAMIDDTWKPENTSAIFTQDGKKIEVNDEQLQMPSVTKLLNRRKLGLSRDLTKTIDRPVRGRGGTGKLKKGTQTGLRKEKSVTLGISKEVKALPPTPVSPRHMGFNSTPAQPSPQAKQPIVPPPFVPKEARAKEKSKIDLPKPPAPTASLAEDVRPVQFKAPSTKLKAVEPPIEQNPALNRTQNRPEIQAIKPRTRYHAKSNLIQWNVPALQKARDPFHQGVLYLIENGAKQALLLCPQASSTVLFEANSAYDPQAKEAIWSGLTFDPAWMGDLAELFLKMGYIELTPEREENSFLASTFGIEKNEWALLVRCGSPKACTGILILVSNQSIKHQVKAAFTSRTQQAA